jgi:hypothetical protein
MDGMGIWFNLELTMAREMSWYMVWNYGLGWKAGSMGSDIHDMGLNTMR